MAILKASNLILKCTLKFQLLKCFYFAKNIHLLANQIPVLSLNKSLIRICKNTIHNDGNTFDVPSDSEDPEFIETTDEFDEVLHSQAKNIPLHTNDPTINKFNTCASVQEVLNLIQSNNTHMKPEYINHAILILWDLQRMFYYYNSVHEFPVMKNNLADQANEYLEKLKSNSSFNILLKNIKTQYKTFNTETLSCTLLHLHKIGLEMKHEVLQLLILEFKERFARKDFTLLSLSRFMIVNSKEKDLGLYLYMQDMIPTIFSQIGNCRTAQEIKLVTICLNSVHVFVTSNVLEAYKKEIANLIEDGIICLNEQRTILKILLFLNYPQWRNQNCELITKCILLFENNVNKLSMVELLILYEIFYKNQEPGSMLNEIQRCASKYLQELEEESSPFYNFRIKLMSCLSCFAISNFRSQIDAFLYKYIYYDLSTSALNEFNKLLIIAKPSDRTISAKFWEKILFHMETNIEFRKHNLLKICNNYTNFHQNVDKFRSIKFENAMCSWIDLELETGIAGLLPNQLSIIAAFVFAFGENKQTLNYVLGKIGENYEQFSHIDCLSITKGLKIAIDTKRNNFNGEFMDVFNNLEKVLENTRDIDINKAKIFIRSFADWDEYMEKIEKRIPIESLENIQFSSKLIKTLTYIFSMTDILLPNILEKMCDYVAVAKYNMLGFNVEKVIHLCYYVGYTPTNSLFFDVATDLILRDHERLTALSFIQAALGLCYFQKIPEIFIKQIFNVEFLEKIDFELDNCYHKDIYPLRVRNTIMQLNRAICLDYPETNVPWFHEKYVNDYKNTLKIVENKPITEMKQTLMDCVPNNYVILENITTPYGYHINFVLDDKKSPKIAILLMRPKSYTKRTIQFKGEIQLKMKHLEILGYNVIPVNIYEWTQSSQEKKESMIKNLLNFK